MQALLKTLAVLLCSAACAFGQGATITRNNAGKTNPSITTLTMDGTNLFLTRGSGDPNGTVTSNPGSLYMDTTGALWIKTTGTGNTGWTQPSGGGGGGPFPWGGSETGHGDSNYTILNTDKIVFTNAAFTAARTWTLPAASTVAAGYAISVIDQQGTVTTSNTLTIQKSASDIIYPPNTSVYIMSTNHQGVTLVSDGTSKWYAISLQPGIGGNGSGTGVFSQQAWTPGVYAGSAYGLPISISGTTGKILQSDGTNVVFSGPTYPTAAGTSGNVLTSNGTNWLSSAPAGGGGGTVTSFSAGDLSPLFTTTETNITTTPALSFTLSTAAAHTFLGNETGSTAAPHYVQPNFTDLAGDFALTQTPSLGASLLIGRGSAGGAGDWEAITLGTNLSMSGTTLNATAGGGGVSSTTGTAPITVSPTTGAVVVSTSMATDSILGRATTGTGVAEVLTALPFAATGEVTRPADSNVQTIDKTISPTWTGQHTWNVTSAVLDPIILISTDSAIGARPLILLDKETSGTAVNGDGPQILFQGKDSTTATQAMGAISNVWTDVTHATHASKMQFHINVAGSALATKATLWSSGGFSVGATTAGGNDSTTDPSTGVINAGVGFQVNNVATSGKILKANGTNFIPSTETYAAPGTSGNVMTSDGTNWTSAVPASGGAGTGLSYITKVAEGTLSNEFALGSLATGLLKNTTTTGVPTIAVAGTDYEAALGNPGTNGFVLSSTTGGTRSWVAQTGGGGPFPWGGSETGHGDSNYTILNTDKIVYTNAAFTAARTWTLPAASTVPAGYAISVIDRQGTVTTTNLLTIQRSASDLIFPPNTSTYIMSGARQGATFESDGVSKWYAISVQPGGGTGASGYFSQMSWTSGVYAGSNYSLPVSTSGTTGKIFRSDGSNVVFSASTYPDQNTTTGKIIRGNGTNFVESTATYPDTAGTSGNVLTSDGTNWSSAAPTGGGAGTGLSYITKVAEGTLSNEFALASLATGLLKNTTTTGVPTIAIAKTDYWDTTDFVASGGSHAHGLVPDPGASAGTTKFLREDATWVVPAGGSASPGGSNTQVQFNDSSAFGGDAGLTYNKTTDSLTIAGEVMTGAATTSSASLNIPAGTLQTTPAAGDIEADANCMYGTTDAGNRGYIGLVAYIRADSTVTYASDTNPHAIFTTPTNGRLTLETGTYRFHGTLGLTNMSATTGNFKVDMLGAGTATTGAWMWTALGGDVAAGAPVNGNGSWMSTSASGSNMFTGQTATAAGVQIDGTFEVTAAGTIIPTLTLQAASAAVLGVGSYIEVWRMGSTTATFIGQWD